MPHGDMAEILGTQQAMRDWREIEWLSRKLLRFFNDMRHG
jgi:hypothetical protein